jgi:uncharacterized protein YndB with AHSA1/START domain
MTPNPVIYTFERTINAPAAQVFRSFTSAMALREWLCDVASVSPRPYGRIYLAWLSGYYVSGDYTKVEENQTISFHSRGRGEPNATTVHVTIKADNGKSHLKLVHEGLQDSPEWAVARHEIQHGWERGLNNLVSVLETGENLRVTQRPMMGVMVGEYNAKRAAELGVPTSEGFRLESVVEGLGAQEAGLLKDDVIISMHSKPTGDFFQFQAAMSGLKAGDRIEVVFYRGVEKKTTSLNLSRRTVPEIPPTATEAGQKYRNTLEDQYKQIAELLEGVSDEKALTHPEPEEWNILQVLAHLIHVERDSQTIIVDRIFDQERVSDGYADNSLLRLDATLKAHPKLADMLDAYRRSQIETVEILTALPASFTCHKGSYWRLMYELLGFPQHTNEHIEQIKALLG